MNSKKIDIRGSAENIIKFLSKKGKLQTTLKVTSVAALIVGFTALASEYGQINASIPDVKVDAKEGIVTYSMDNSVVIKNIVSEGTSIVAEKDASDASMNFSDTKEIKYVEEKTELLNSPSAKATKQLTVNKGMALNVIGYNQNGYARISYKEDTMYVQAEMLTDKDYIFTGTNKTAVTTTLVTVYGNIDDAKADKNAINFINNGNEIKVISENEKFVQITTSTDIKGYIYADKISYDKKYNFKSEDKTMYSKGENAVYENLEKSAKILTKIPANTQVQVLGTNDKSEYVKVNANGVIGYMKANALSAENYDLYPFLTLSAKSNVAYNVGNMPDGIVSVLPDSEKTDENVYFLAQLIECEAGGEGFEGTRAVGTVVVNRVFANGWGGSTIKDVIESPKQFSPVTNGAVYSKIPSQASYEAAVDVIYNGYRSFPAYVLSFQSIRDGYWSNQITYMTTYTEAGTYPQYFSYRECDARLYSK